MDGMAIENIGEKIVKYRKINGVSQKHLAEQLDISSQGLLKIEKGQVKPRADTLARIINVLCITPNQLFGTEEMDEESYSVIARLQKMQTADKSEKRR